MGLSFFKKAFGGLFVLLLLLNGVFVATSLISKNQDTRSKAAGSVVLSLSPSTTTPTVGTLFTVTLNANGGTADIAAIQAGITYSSNLTLERVDKGSAFTLPAGYEMLSLGISCTQDNECRSAAQFALGDDIKCVSGTCRHATNNLPPSNTVILGAPCPVTMPNPARPNGESPCLTINSGVVAVYTFRPTSNGTATVGFNTANTQTAVVGQTTDQTDTTQLNAVNLNVSGGATANATMNLKLKLPEYSSTSSTPSQLTAKNTRVILKNGTTEVSRQTVALTADTAPANFGIYSGTMTNITPGTYDVYVKPWAHLQKNIGSVTFTGGVAATKDVSSNITFIAGDVAGSIVAANLGNPDNLVDTSDWQKILANMGFTQIAPTDAKAFMDLNSDGYIDTTDLQIVFKNMSMTSGDGEAE